MVRKKMRLSQDALTEIFLFSVLFISYVYVFPRWADPNQNSRLDMVVAVVDDGTFQIDRYVSNTVDYAHVGEHYYSDKAPGAAFLGIPVYWGVRLILDLPWVSNITENLANNQAFKATLNPEGTGVFEEKVRFAIAQVAITLVTAALPTAMLGVFNFQKLKACLIKNIPSYGGKPGVWFTYSSFSLCGCILWSSTFCNALILGIFPRIYSKPNNQTISLGDWVSLGVQYHHGISCCFDRSGNRGVYPGYFIQKETSGRYNLVGSTWGMCFGCLDGL